MKKKKITITLNENAIEWAKIRSEEENRNLSNWIETLIEKDEKNSIFYETSEYRN